MYGSVQGNTCSVRPSASLWPSTATLSIRFHACEIANAARPGTAPGSSAWSNATVSSLSSADAGSVAASAGAPGSALPCWVAVPSKSPASLPARSRIGFVADDSSYATVTVAEGLVTCDPRVSVTAVSPTATAVTGFPAAAVTVKAAVAGVEPVSSRSSK